MTAAARAGRAGTQPGDRAAGARWWVLGAYAWALLPHLRTLPPWVPAAALTLALWPLTARRLPAPGWLRLLLVLAAVPMVALHYGTLLGREAGVALLALMLGLKLLELGSARDRGMALFLSAFLLGTAALEAQTPLLAGWMLLGAPLFLAALAATLCDPPPDARAALRQGFTLALQALPLALLLFLLFPRISGPLWHLPEARRPAVTGLGDRMEPGSIGRLIASDAVAFRVTFQGPLPPPGARYFRGPVLSRTADGRLWLRSPGKARRSPVPGSGRWRYTVTLEPSAQPWLPVLDRPTALPESAYLDADGTVLAPAPVRSRLRYEASSAPPDAIPPAAAVGPPPPRYLALPATANPRTRALGRRLRAQTGDEAEVIARILAMFHDQAFSYTLEPGRLGADPVDTFLFETRRGFCEHYAAATATLLRAAGIPARIVTGYQGGELNPIGGYLIVRQYDAHAWVEAWLPGRGWQRVDPTAAIAPERIEARLPGGPGSFGARQGSSIWHRFALARDWLDLLWTRWVLGYDQHRQRSLLEGLGIPDAGWRELTAGLAAASALLLAGTWFLTAGRRRARSPLERAWHLFCARMAAAGVAREPWEGPTAYARRIRRLQPGLATEAEAIAGEYAALRYGPGFDPERVRRLQRRIRRLPPRARLPWPRPGAPGRRPPPGP